MSKLFDFILSRLFMFGFFVVVLLAFVPVIWYNLAISAIATILVSLILKVAKLGSKKRISYKAFELYCITEGADYILSTLALAMPSYHFTQGEGVLLGNNKDKSIALLPMIKFGSVGNDEVLKLHAKAVSLGVTVLYFIAREIDRKSQLIMHNYSKEVVFVPLSVVYKMLKAKKMLPSITSAEREKRSITSEIFNVIFARVNIKRFLFVAVVLYLMSLLIPFKTYYITLGSINVVLAIICIARDRTQSFYGKYGVFDEQIKHCTDTDNHTSAISMQADDGTNADSTQADDSTDKTLSSTHKLTEHTTDNHNQNHDCSLTQNDHLGNTLDTDDSASKSCDGEDTSMTENHDNDVK